MMRKALNDPGYFVHRATMANGDMESLVDWQCRAYEEAVNPSPRRFVLAGNRRYADDFAREHNLGYEGRHWFYVTDYRRICGIWPLQLLIAYGAEQRSDYRDCIEYVKARSANTTCEHGFHFNGAYCEEGCNER